MAQDLRNLFENDQKDSQLKMSEGHETRFLEKLDNALPEETSIKKRFSSLQIAASIVVLIGLVFGAYKFSQQPKSITNQVVTNDNQTSEDQLKSLGDISPDLKRVENYYLANISLELSKIKQTPENKELFDGYVVRLAELNQEYKRLSVELTENGPNELTISALIDNLKLRLNLLYRLKEQLHDLNASDEAKLNT
ncbi:hypothetical protein [Psychroserpens ponticola]|uniref:Anti-sigma factor n=1 Tax=Psychroserpens ponticola TaxID=2932268 RepID=A0ABY7RZK4_9FLAO|nr:hypothetical protein [Psychroserpens ponticola]WCO02497.1 hypothetical protein MUN68_003150 [Psychroserpens ponticola]